MYCSMSDPVSERVSEWGMEVEEYRPILIGTHANIWLGVIQLFGRRRQEVGLTKRKRKELSHLPVKPHTAHIKIFKYSSHFLKHKGVLLSKRQYNDFWLFTRSSNLLQCRRILIVHFIVLVNTAHISQYGLYCAANAESSLAYLNALIKLFMGLSKKEWFHHCNRSRNVLFSYMWRCKKYRNTGIWNFCP